MFSSYINEAVFPLSLYTGCHSNKSTGQAKLYTVRQIFCSNHMNVNKTVSVVACLFFYNYEFGPVDGALLLLSSHIHPSSVLRMTLHHANFYV